MSFGAQVTLLVLMPSILVAQGYSVTSSLAFTMVMNFGSLFAAAGVGGMFVMLAVIYVILAAAAIFAPETMGRSLEDINQEDQTPAHV